MSITTYAPRAEYVGTGAVSDYTFDFKMASLEHLLVVVSDDLFVQTFNVRGSDTTYLTGVVFDATNGAGTVSLVTPLPLNHNIAIILAHDAPLQEYEFRNKSDFTLRSFESALDIVMGAIQRLTYSSKRSLKVTDTSLDATAFDYTIPTPVAGMSLKVNAGGTAFEWA